MLPSRVVLRFRSPPVIEPELIHGMANLSCIGDRATNYDSMAIAMCSFASAASGEIASTRYDQQPGLDQQSCATVPAAIALKAAPPSAVTAGSGIVTAGRAIKCHQIALTAAPMDALLVVPCKSTTISCAIADGSRCASFFGCACSPPRWQCPHRALALCARSRPLSTSARAYANCRPISDICGAEWCITPGEPVSPRNRT
jgi:hypothetical protein